MFIRSQKLKRSLVQTFWFLFCALWLWIIISTIFIVNIVTTIIITIIIRRHQFYKKREITKSFCLLFKALIQRSWLSPSIGLKVVQKVIFLTMSTCTLKEIFHSRTAKSNWCIITKHFLYPFSALPYVAYILFHHRLNQMIVVPAIL